MQSQKPDIKKELSIGFAMLFIFIAMLIVNFLPVLEADSSNALQDAYYNIHLHFGFILGMVIAIPTIALDLIRYRKSGIRSRDRKDLSRRQKIWRFIYPILFLLVIFSDDIYMDIYTRAVDKKIFAQIAEVEVDHEPLANAGKFIADLRAMNTSPKRHQGTHPTTPFDVLLKTGEGDLHLRLYRDSEKPDLYWIFYPHTGLDSFIDSDIAYVTTPVLGALK